MKSTKLFCYWNGKDHVKADPFKLAVRMNNLYPEASNLEHDWDMMSKVQKPESVDAYERLISWVRRVFDVPVYRETDEGVAVEGLTDEEVFALFTNFNDWQEAVKKNTVSPPTSQPPTESASSTGSALTMTATSHSACGSFVTA